MCPLLADVSIAISMESTCPKHFIIRESCNCIKVLGSLNGFQRLVVDHEFLQVTFFCSIIWYQLSKEMIYYELLRYSWPDF